MNNIIVSNEYPISNQRHISTLYSKPIFNENVTEIAIYAEQQTKVLANQRTTGTVEIRQLVLLGHCFFELKNVDAFKMSMDLYREALTIIEASPHSKQQVDYAYVLACHAVALHSHEYYMDGKKQVQRFHSNKLREPNEVYDQIVMALEILKEINYTGPQLGVIMNMYVFCAIKGKTAWIILNEMDQVKPLKEIVSSSLLNLKSNGLNDDNSDVIDCYYLQGSTNVIFKEKKEARILLLKSIELYSQIYKSTTHPKIADAYSRICSTCLDHRDEKLGVLALSMKKSYYGINHFETIEPLYSIYYMHMSCNTYNLSLELELNSVQKQNGLKSNDQQIWSGAGCHCNML